MYVSYIAIKSCVFKEQLNNESRECETHRTISFFKHSF